MTDLLHDLTGARPTDTDLDRLWSPAERAAVLDRVQLGRSGRPARRNRRRGALLVAAAAVAAVVVVPGVIDSGDATAADLQGLALSAAAYDGSVLQPGSWLHETSTSVQRNRPPTREVARIDAERETWTRWDGRVLLIEHRPSAGWTTYDVVDGTDQIDDVDAVTPQNPASYQDPSPQFAATLPDTADGLLAYLDPRVFGSSSHQEALYSALTSLASSHTLPPQTLAATFEALAQVKDVRTDDVTVGGRPGIEIRFTEDQTSSSGTLVVDRATGQVLSTRDRSRQSDYTSTTTLSEVVSEVPADVLTAFTTHAEGVRYGASGAALPG